MALQGLSVELLGRQQGDQQAWKGDGEQEGGGREATDR